LHEALFQTPAFSIAVITITEHLKTSLKIWTEETLAEIHRPQEGEQFFFRCFDPATISPTELFLAPSWQQAFGTGFTPLLILEEEQRITTSTT
jgi:hypothetical protein